MSQATNKPANYKKLSVSLIAIVRDEADSIAAFLASYKRQTKHAAEFLLVDAGSQDGTPTIIARFAKQNPHLKIKLIARQGANRSQARNLAVTLAKSDYLAFTDAGCILKPDWLEQLTAEQLQSQQQVIGGWFRGLAKNKLQEAMVPYFLQLPRRLTAEKFVPTTRSLLIAKETFTAAGGFNERLELSEDYDLMLRLRAKKIPWALAKRALVFWLPPHDYLEFLRKISSFAQSDIEAGIVRPKVISIYGRYLLLFGVAIWSPSLALILLLLYLSWSIAKNYHNCPTAWYYLPFLQISTDLVIMWASLLALKNFKSRAL